MITYTGRSVWPEWNTPEGEEIRGCPSLDDIAVGLGRMPRFAGQTDAYYTVLSHSIAGSQLAYEFIKSFGGSFRPLPLVMLLHDAHEAITGDTPTTWKSDEAKRDQLYLDDLIWERYGVDLGREKYWAMDQMKALDFELLRAEAHFLGHREAEKWWPSSKWNELTHKAFDITKMVYADQADPTDINEMRGDFSAAYVTALSLAKS